LRPFFSIELVPKDPLWKLAIASTIIQKAGFDGIWVSEHFFNRNSLVSLSTIALHTKKVIVGPAVLNPYTMHPLLIAQAAASLWELAPHRVRVAVGAGDGLALSKLGIRRVRPVETVMKAVADIKNALSAEGVLKTYNTGDIKVFVGATGPRMLEASTSVADGVLVNWSDREMLEKAITMIKGKAPEKFWKAAYLITSVHEDAAKARKTAIPFAAYLMVGASPQYLSKIGVDEGFRLKVEELLDKGDWESLYRISDGEWVDRFCVWGEPSKLAELVEDLVEKGYDEVVFAGPLGPRFLYAVKKISHIIKRIRREFLKKQASR
jgi:5,10-methylenetetrahydromethanopterin reductase